MSTPRAEREESKLALSIRLWEEGNWKSHPTTAREEREKQEERVMHGLCTADELIGSGGVSRLECGTIVMIMVEADGNADETKNGYRIRHYLLHRCGGGDARCRIRIPLTRAVGAYEELGLIGDPCATVAEALEIINAKLEKIARRKLGEAKHGMWRAERELEFCIGHYSEIHENHMSHINEEDW